MSASKLSVALVSWAHPIPRTIGERDSPAAAAFGDVRLGDPCRKAQFASDWRADGTRRAFSQLPRHAHLLARVRRLAADSGCCAAATVARVLARAVRPRGALKITAAQDE